MELVILALILAAILTTGFLYIGAGISLIFSATKHDPRWMILYTILFATALAVGIDRYL